MNRYDSVRLIFLGLVALAMELTVSGRLAFHGGRPEFLLILACFAALFAAHPRQGYWTAWLLGLGKDIGSACPLGVHALIFLGIAWVILSIRKVVFREHPLVQCVLAFVAALTMNALMATLVCILHGGLPFGIILLKTLLGALFTAVLAPIVLWMLRGRRSYLQPRS